MGLASSQTRGPLCGETWLLTAPARWSSRGRDWAWRNCGYVSLFHAMFNHYFVSKAFNADIFHQGNWHRVTRNARLSTTQYYRGKKHEQKKKLFKQNSQRPLEQVKLKCLSWSDDEIYKVTKKTNDVNSTSSKWITVNLMSSEFHSMGEMNDNSARVNRFEMIFKNEDIKGADWWTWRRPFKPRVLSMETNTKKSLICWLDNSDY